MLTALTQAPCHHHSCHSWGSRIVSGTLSLPTTIHDCPFWITSERNKDKEYIYIYIYIYIKKYKESGKWILFSSWYLLVCCLNMFEPSANYIHANHIHVPASIECVSITAKVYASLCQYATFTGSCCCIAGRRAIKRKDNKTDKTFFICLHLAFGLRTHIDLAFSLPWKTDINGHQTSPEVPSCSIDLKATCFCNCQTWPCKSDSQSYCTRISVQHRRPGFGFLLSGSRTQAIYHHWYSIRQQSLILNGSMTHLASIYKPSWKEAAGNKNYHHPPLHCANDDHFDFNIVTIMTIYNSQNGAASSPPNNLLADSATAGTKRLKPCGCLCCLIIYSWQYQRGMILFNVKYTRMSIWASCLETCWNQHSKTTLG